MIEFYHFRRHGTYIDLRVEGEMVRFRACSRRRIFHYGRFGRKFIDDLQFNFEN